MVNGSEDKLVGRFIDIGQDVPPLTAADEDKARVIDFATERHGPDIGRELAEHLHAHPKANPTAALDEILHARFGNPGAKVSDLEFNTD